MSVPPQEKLILTGTRALMIFSTLLRLQTLD